MKRLIAPLAVALVGFPSVAAAMPPEPAAPTPAPVNARGTDVAAPDQQASQPGPMPVSAPADDGVDWTDAGLGALAGVALAGVAAAGAVGLRRRRAAPLRA